LREYELVVILSPQVADDDVEEALSRLIRQPVESRGGEVLEVNHWGRRKLAYPIQRHLEGNYVLFQIRVDPAHTKELEQRLLISEEVLRHLLVRAEEVATAEQK
jgi:small subunit ribosomal protein S6